ncbi:carbohydrate ABC transporter permease [Oricola indica]|uniref:carbohydrate ABC transporter permease n=1 Tax=Oricola indica TaxID=2872591 RepID=UPI003CCB9ECA
MARSGPEQANEEAWQPSRLSRLIESDGFAAAVMILPATLLLGTFFLWPFFYGVWLSMTNWDGFSQPAFIGLRNFTRLWSDRIFLGALENNVIFVFWVVILKNVLGLAVGLLLQRAGVGRAFFRASIFLPVTMSFVAVGLLWSWIYNPIFGLLNAVLDFTGMSGLKLSWLGDANVALYSVIAVDVWKWLGFHSVIYLAGLQALPTEVYDSARIDGASAWHRFRYITVPLMMPVIFINTILAFSGAFVRNFDIVYVLTKGGPNHATEVVLTDMMNRAFSDGAIGYAAAMGYVLFLIVVVLSVGLLMLMRRWRLEV